MILAVVYDLNVYSYQIVCYLQFRFAWCFIFMNLNLNHSLEFFLNKFIGKIQCFPKV